jgi:uncharacterized protein DUF6650
VKKIYFNDIVSRFTGISTAVFGISWNPPPDERKLAEEVITYIENKGLFYAPFEWEHPLDSYNSASAIRDELTEMMKRLRRKKELFQQLEIIRNSVREFQRSLRKQSLESIPSKTQMNNDQIKHFDGSLVDLRRHCGSQIAIIAVKYGLDVYAELDYWLKPPDKGQSI